MSRGRNSSRLSRWHRRALYSAGLSVWISGVVWLYYRFLAAPIATDLGPSPHPAQAVWMKIHGAAAMAGLIVAGTLLTVHVPAGWRQHRSTRSGFSLLVGTGVLAITGWGLYYLGNERLRAATSTVHWIFGLAAPIVLLLHLRGRSRTRSENDGSRPQSRAAHRRARLRDGR